ncbi:hypothetical protein WMF31_10695 [Sorangium sp. So ce1036]|uniref:hypothetical protein n=1 Tax=Sorangium sp. So ce1036 TaxID=3133328 RepID=UPI003EFD079E
MQTPRIVLSAAVLLAACGGAPASSAPVAADPAVGGPSPSSPAAPPSAPPTATAPPPTAAAAATAAAVPAPAPCGALGCLAFDEPDRAFAHVLGDGPRVLAVGESHAQQGAEGIPSATRRFTERFLPALAGRASDLIIELWVADPRCKKEQAARVEEEQRAVTQGQAADNQGEFLALGHAAKRLGIQPHALTPSCDEVDAIARAGADAVPAMLEMIARLTAARAKALLGREDRAGKMIVAYGGALHNDIAPRPGRERWSFGPELAASTGGKYVELDIIVREFIKDTAPWRALPWYPHFDREEHPDRTVLFNPAPGSYVLIFPRTR